MIFKSIILKLMETPLHINDSIIPLNRIIEHLSWFPARKNLYNIVHISRAQIEVNCVITGEFFKNRIFRTVIHSLLNADDNYC